MGLNLKQSINTLTGIGVSDTEILKVNNGAVDADPHLGVDKFILSNPIQALASTLAIAIQTYAGSGVTLKTPDILSSSQTGLWFYITILFFVFI